MSSRFAVPALLFFLLAFLSSGSGRAQNPSPAESQTEASSYTVATGTHVPLGLINSVSTKHSEPGDRVYVETVFPIVIDSRIVIPPGSYVTGTVTEVKRP